MPAPQFRRPESVLIVIHTGGEFLMLERVKPAGFWQSVTGSLEWGETPASAAPREVAEETGIRGGTLTDLHLVQEYEILPAFGRIYAPGITRNREHAFSLELAGRVPVVLSPREHVGFRWLGAEEAQQLASSHTNRHVIGMLRGR